ncbi:hypothetical protein Lalb_Chr13g0291701 [Lupinus albus]|uniref:Uncharacterized protein n=1 Tax=Lupinus albus TaxID=3870 RepID=A0A6A4PHD5_LUPAL|nr:hypothetical protein Lalb_Chr13g0291701 [Lupinus albus]
MMTTRPEARSLFLEPAGLPLGLLPISLPSPPLIPEPGSLPSAAEAPAAFVGVLAPSFSSRSRFCPWLKFPLPLCSSSLFWLLWCWN